MFPLSADLVRSMDEERRRTLRRHVRRQRRRRLRRVQDTETPRPREPLVWADQSGSTHLVDHEGLARLDEGSRFDEGSEAASGPQARMIPR